MIIYVRDNDSYCSVYVQDSDLVINDDPVKQLRENFSIYANNYRMSTKFKKGSWDGKIYPITLRGAFRIGMLIVVVKFLEEQGYKILLKDYRKNVKRISFDRNLIECPLPNIKYTEYQLDALKSIGHTIFRGIYYLRGCYSLPVNFGKTYIICQIIAMIKYKPDIKILILVPTDIIFNQILYELNQFLKTSYGFYGNIDEIGILRSGEIRIKNITIAMVRSLINAYDRGNYDVKDYVDNLSLIIADESHRYGSSENMKFINKLKLNNFIFLSGTSEGNRQKESVLNSLILYGRYFYKFADTEMYKNRSMKPSVIIQNCEYNPHNLSDFDTYEQHHESFICNNPQRDNDIVNFCINNPTRIALISVSRIEHCNLLCRLLNSNGVPTEQITGETVDRTIILDMVLSGEIRVIVSTTLKEGLNLPLLDTLILADVGKSYLKVIQYIGRIVRQHDGKKPIIFDINDTESKYLTRQHQVRLRYYRELGLDIVNINNSDYKPEIYDSGRRFNSK